MWQQSKSEMADGGGWKFCNADFQEQGLSFTSSLLRGSRYSMMAKRKFFTSLSGSSSWQPNICMTWIQSRFLELIMFSLLPSVNPNHLYANSDRVGAPFRCLHWWVHNQDMDNAVKHSMHNMFWNSGPSYRASIRKHSSSFQDNFVSSLLVVAWLLQQTFISFLTATLNSLKLTPYLKWPWLN